MANARHAQHIPSNRLALSATIHCLTGCSIGEVLGMVTGTVLGLNDGPTIALSIALAFLFGYLLTMWPLLRARVAFKAALGLALASDTVSIAIMEIVDNAVMLVIPGAMDARLGDLKFWGTLALSLLIAGAAAFPVVRWLIARGRGHAVVHEYHAREGGGHDHQHRVVGQGRHRPERASSAVTPQGSTLRSFFILSYVLTWVLLAPWFYVFNVVYHEDIPGWLWAFAPLAFLGGWGPSIAALIVSAREGGRAAVGRLLRSLTVWRVPPLWYLATLALPPLVTAASLLVVDRGPGTLRSFDLGAALANVPVAYALALPFGPLGEELGWRGLALPRLLIRFGPAKASVLLGLAWTFWHVPMMLWSPGASMPAFMGLSVTAVVTYMVQITAITAMMTVLFLRTNGSVLLAVLAHLAFNTAEAVLFGGLPRLDPGLRRAVYIANVAGLAVLGTMSLVWLARRPRDGGGMK